MNKFLTKEELSQYLVKNDKYYEKYLEKFNQKKHFYSWNWAALLIPQLWLPYRKQWGLFIVLFIFTSMALFVSYISIIHPREVSPYLLLGISVVTIVFMLYMPLKVNQKVLEHATLFKNSQGYNSWPIVLVACLIFTAPIQLFLYKVGLLIIKEQRITMLESLSSHQYSDKKILGVIEVVPSKSFTAKAKYELLCYDNKIFLSALSAKNIKFSSEDLRTAYRCKAVHTLAYIVQSGIAPSNGIVNDAIYRKNIDMVKAFLDSKPQITQQYLAYALQEDKEQVDEVLAEYLLSKTKDISQPYRYKNGDIVSALGVALNSKNLKWAERLLQEGANPNIIIYGDVSLLKREVAKQSLKSIDLLLQNKADPNFHDNDYHSAILERAIRTNNPQVVEKILQAGGVIIPRILKINKELYESKFQNQDIWSDTERESSSRITQLLEDYGAKK